MFQYDAELYKRHKRANHDITYANSQETVEWAMLHELASAAHILVANVTSRDLCFHPLESPMVEHVGHFQLTRAALS